MPNIWLTEDFQYGISGKLVTEADYPELRGRIGPDEAAVEVPIEMIEKFLAEQKKTA